eukprot:TRINITY_DN6922_c0_g1_i2.p1 TRINITY_DN6922_c0_g1~~TRINITY_DN6922_c0_g1_i2.p1  ORF type:complete len:153 (+),score=30.02 TRINITY_DN6922_c0_g1_i2:322-780(+)
MSAIQLRTTKPSYLSMVKDAIKHVQPSPRTAVSIPAIHKFICTKYPVNQKIFARYVRRAVQIGVQSKQLIRVRNSFRLSISGTKKSSRKTTTISTRSSASNATKKTEESKKRRSAQIAAKRNAPAPVTISIEAPAAVPSAKPAVVPPFSLSK